MVLMNESRVTHVSYQGTSITVILAHHVAEGGAPEKFGTSGSTQRGSFRFIFKVCWFEHVLIERELATEQWLSFRSLANWHFRGPLCLRFREHYIARYAPGIMNLGWNACDSFSDQPVVRSWEHLSWDARIWHSGFMQKVGIILADYWFVLYLITHRTISRQTSLTPG